MIRLQQEKGSEKNDADRREERRVNTNDLRFRLQSGNGEQHGLICNISSVGLCGMGLSEPLLDQAGPLEIVVDEDGELYRLSIRLRWQVELQSGVQIGACIENADAAWHDLVKRRGGFSLA